jgi:hypothetical protein
LMFRTWESQVQQLDMLDTTRWSRASNTQHSRAMLASRPLIVHTIIYLCLNCFINTCRKIPVYLVLCHNQCISFVS